MSKRTLPDWDKYWANFNDLDVLRQKSTDLDETLQLIEKEFDTKLMSGDHMQIVASLEDRIDELERTEQAKKSAVQTNLFDDM